MFMSQENLKSTFIRNQMDFFATPLLTIIIQDVCGWRSEEEYGSDTI